MAGDGDRQERRAGGLLLWRFFLIDKSRTPSVHKKCTHLKKEKEKKKLVTQKAALGAGYLDCREELQASLR